MTHPPSPIWPLWPIPTPRTRSCWPSQPTGWSGSSPPMHRTLYYYVEQPYGSSDSWPGGNTAGTPAASRLGRNPSVFRTAIGCTSTTSTLAATRTLPLGRCAVGWAVLDGNDPTAIVARRAAAGVRARLGAPRTNSVGHLRRRACPAW